MSELSLARFVVAVLLALAVVGGITEAEAQERRPGAKAEASRARAGCRFFRRAPLDFWGDKKQRAETAATRKESPSGLQQESLWAEPIRQPNGQISVYVPPKAVLEFLQNPTRESGKAYLAWQAERMKQLKASIEILRELKIESEGGPAVPNQEAGPIGPLPLNGPAPIAAASPTAVREILYFKRTGCPYCAKQDTVFQTLKKTHPHVAVRTLMPEDEPELWKAYGVKVVPSMVLRGPNQKRVMLRGFMTAKDLVRVIEEVNRGKP